MTHYEDTSAIVYPPNGRLRQGPASVPIQYAEITDEEGWLEPDPPIVNYDDRPIRNHRAPKPKRINLRRVVLFIVLAVGAVEIMLALVLIFGFGKLLGEYR